MYVWVSGAIMGYLQTTFPKLLGLLLAEGTGKKQEVAGKGRGLLLNYFCIIPRFPVPTTPRELQFVACTAQRPADNRNCNSISGPNA